MSVLFHCRFGIEFPQMDCVCIKDRDCDELLSFARNMLCMCISMYICKAHTRTHL